MAHIRDYTNRHVHFIGIGGCSMSGLAGLMRSLGYTVTGSDRDHSHKTDALIEGGIPVAIGHRAESVNGADFIVYTAAIPEDNVERAAARAQGIPEIERSELLGQLMEGYQNAIGISGTHGKTTTTAMMAQVFHEAGVKPTVHIGGELKALGGSTMLGDKEYFIAEACEFAASFLKLNPTVAVLLNIDEDHLDFYRDIEHIEEAFLEFAQRTSEDGYVVGWGDDERVRRVLHRSNRATRTYGLEPHNELRAEDLSYDELGHGRFRATLFGHSLMELELSVPGEHNVLNALAVIAVASLMELPMQRVAEILSRFTGAQRRFELTGIIDGVKLYHDYGHNPAEMKNAIHIAKLQPHRRLFAVWQPHTYSRTKKLFDGFLETFTEADQVVITDICAAREQDPGDIHSAMFIKPLTERGVKVVHTPSFDDAEQYLRANWQPEDLVITLGCGNIDLLNEQIGARGDTVGAEYTMYNV